MLGPLDESVYEQIAALVQANKCCTHDYRNRHPYTPENPCVARNICLSHFLEKHPNLRYLDEEEVNKDNKRVFRFVDTQGYLYRSIEDNPGEAVKDLTSTLAYYGFTPPYTVAYQGKVVTFNVYYATLYGDFQTASVLVLAYNQTVDKVKGLFLLYKNGPAKELNKRGAQKALFERAEEIIEATKDTEGYHLGDRTFYRRSDSQTYEVISQLESAWHDAAVKLQNGKRPVTTDLRSEENTVAVSEE